MLFVLLLTLVGTSVRFFRMRKRPEDVHNPGISGARSDQPPGRILTTPVETVVEAGLTVTILLDFINRVFPHIQVHPEAAILNPLEAALLNLLEAETPPLQKGTIGRVGTGPGLEIIL